MRSWWNEWTGMWFWEERKIYLHLQRENIGEREIKYYKVSWKERKRERDVKELVEEEVFHVNSE